MREHPTLTHPEAVSPRRRAGVKDRLAVVTLTVILTGAAVGFLREGLQVQAAHTGESVPFDTSEWKTNFKKHSINLNEIIAGGARARLRHDRQTPLQRPCDVRSADGIVVAAGHG